MGKGDKKSKKEPWIEDKCRRCGRHRCRCKDAPVSYSSSSSSSCASGVCGIILNQQAGQASSAAQIINKTGLVCANGVCGVRQGAGNSSGLDRPQYPAGTNLAADAAKPDPQYVVRVNQPGCASCGGANHSTSDHDQPRVVPYNQAKLPGRRPDHPPGCRCRECSGYW